MKNRRIHAAQQVCARPALLFLRYGVCPGAAALHYPQHDVGSADGLMAQWCDAGLRY